jgi:hypothetical protein
MKVASETNSPETNNTQPGKTNEHPAPSHPKVEVNPNLGNEAWGSLLSIKSADMKATMKSKETPKDYKDSVRDVATRAKTILSFSQATWVDRVKQVGTALLILTVGYLGIKDIVETVKNRKDGDEITEL